MRRWPILLVLSACKAPAPVPTWAFDPIWIEPTADDGIHGVQTWQLFGEKWHEKRKEKHYVCAIVVDLVGTPAKCPGCRHAWTVQTELLETDCDPTLAEEPVVTALRGVGIGGAVASADAPYPTTYVGWVDYGSGWEEHGWAYPAALDEGGVPTSNEWDGEQPFTLWPTLDWPWPPPAQ